MRKKYLGKVVNKLAQFSFRNGSLVESQVIKTIKLLKLQPASEAIQALSEYLKQLKRKEREHTMYIEAVISLSPIQIKKVKKIVEKKVKITKVLTNINPQILGGFRLRVGDEIWDESILAKISQVQEAIRG